MKKIIGKRLSTIIGYFASIFQRKPALGAKVSPHLDRVSLEGTPWSSCLSIDIASFLQVLESIFILLAIAIFYFLSRRSPASRTTVAILSIELQHSRGRHTARPAMSEGRGWVHCTSFLLFCRESVVTASYNRCYIPEPQSQFCWITAFKRARLRLLSCSRRAAMLTPDTLLKEVLNCGIFSTTGHAYLFFILPREAFVSPDRERSWNGQERRGLGRNDR